MMIALEKSNIVKIKFSGYNIIVNRYLVNYGWFFLKNYKERMVYMKKIIIWIMTVTLCIILVGCNEKNSTDKKVNSQDFFNGFVVDVFDDNILVECEEQMQSSFSKGEQVKIPLDVVTAEGTPELHIGDKVRIVYSGRENSEQIEIVYAIYLIAEDGTL